MTKHKHSIAIIGKGNFGRFMARHLKPHARVVLCDQHSRPDVVASCDVAIFAVPYGALKDAITQYKPHIRQGALIVDVTSVKVHPLKLLKQQFPRHEILGTHPLFGPESGRHGIAGLKIVLCNVTCAAKRYQQMKTFVRRELKLNVLEMTAAEHDQSMAHVQALTHLIGRALSDMHAPTLAASTPTYETLLKVKQSFEHDSWALFETIENANPYAATVRDRYHKAVAALEEKLKQS